MIAIISSNHYSQIADKYKRVLIILYYAVVYQYKIIHYISACTVRVYTCICVCVCIKHRCIKLYIYIYIKL